MKLLINRPTQCGSKATISKMTVDGLFFCYTLEDVDRRLEAGGIKVQNQTAIPRGIYEVIIDHSDHFGKEMPHILNVPGFSGVRIHTGSTDADTEGCLIVGNNIVNDDFINGSRVTFEKLFDLLESAYARKEKIELEIV